MKNKYKKRIIFSVLSAAIFSLSFFITLKIKAATTDNGKGWAWGGSTDSSGIATGLGWISLNDTNFTGQAISYGVSFPTTIGGFASGYAWSSNVGYIDFNPHSGCPSSPKYLGACDEYPSIISNNDVEMPDNTKILKGWARVVNIAVEKSKGNAGGYDGWILFGKNPEGIEDVELDDADVDNLKLDGYAWSSDFGWIDMTDALTGATDSTFSYSCTETFNCDSSNCEDPIENSVVCIKTGDQTRSTYSATIQDCIDNDVLCAVKTETCPPCPSPGKWGSWQEVAPTP